MIEEFFGGALRLIDYEDQALITRSFDQSGTGETAGLEAPLFRDRSA